MEKLVYAFIGFAFVTLFATGMVLLLYFGLFGYFPEPVVITRVVAIISFVVIMLMFFGWTSGDF